MFSERHIIVDIGGNGGRALRQADLIYSTPIFIVDPKVSPVERVQGNIHFLSQPVDEQTPLPFEPGAVHIAYVDYLMGEIQNPNGANANDEEAIELYRVVVQELRRVMSPSGYVQVMDVRRNIHFARRVFEECGFLTTTPLIVTNRKASYHTEEFFRIFLQQGLPADRSAAIPMEFIADVPQSRD